MTKSFLTATALVALLGFGATAALAQSAPKLDTPVIQKSAPVESGKAASGTMQDKSKATNTVKPATSNKAKSSAASCTGLKDKAAHDACMKTQAKSSKAAPVVNQKAATPDKTKPMVAPAPRG